MTFNDVATYYVYCTNDHVSPTTLMKMYGKAQKEFAGYKRRSGKNIVKVMRRRVDGKLVITATSYDLIKAMKNYLNSKFAPIGIELFLIDNNYFRDIKENEPRDVLEVDELYDANKYYVYCASKLGKEEMTEVYKGYFKAMKFYKGEMGIRDDKKQVFTTPNLKNAKLVKDYMNEHYNKYIFKIDNSYYRDED